MYRASDLKKDAYKPKEAASLLGVTVKTIQNYDKKGTLTVRRTPTNRRVIMRDDLIAYLAAQGSLICDDEDARRDVVYVRVDDPLDAKGLDTQALSVLQAVSEARRPLVLKEAASGSSDDRPEYRRLLEMVCQGRVRNVYVQTEGTLSVSGFHTLQTMFQGYGTKIVVTAEN